MINYFICGAECTIEKLSKDIPSCYIRDKVKATQPTQKPMS